MSLYDVSVSPASLVILNTVIKYKYICELYLVEKATPRNKARLENDAFHAGGSIFSVLWIAFGREANSFTNWVHSGVLDGAQYAPKILSNYSKRQ